MGNTTDDLIEQAKARIHSALDASLDEEAKLIAETLEILVNVKRIEIFNENDKENN